MLRDVCEKGVVMRKKLKTLLLVAPIFIIGCAGSSKYMVKATPAQELSASKALVYFMRPSGFGFAINFQIWEGYKLIGLSQAKSYFAYQCEPGKHLFIGRAENKRALEADLEAGKSYYIITQVKMGGWKARMAFIPVNRDSEYWDKVELYKKKLNFIVPNEEEIGKWTAKREAEIREEIDEITDYIKTPEGQKYIVYIGKEDGR